MNFTLSIPVGVAFCAGLLISAPSRAEVFTGVVTDAMCGRDHSAMNIKPETKCITECVKMGSKYALLDGSKVYELSDQKTPEKFLGQKVKVSGTLDKKTIQVQSMQAAK